MCRGHECSRCGTGARHDSSIGLHIGADPIMIRLAYEYRILPILTGGSGLDYQYCSGSPKTINSHRLLI